MKAFASGDSFFGLQIGKVFGRAGLLNLSYDSGDACEADLQTFSFYHFDYFHWM